MDDATINQLRTILSQNQWVSFAYLFGSRAAGKAGSRSDWDIAVYITDAELERNPVWQKIKIEDEISLALKTDNIQVVILNGLDAPLFAFTIINKGIVLADKNQELRVTFECNTLRRFHDWQYYLDRHLGKAGEAS
ncbi:MAG: nucleotidyltransferase domain-containing protein [Planctomycetes bacterium]|nr:nucleotidyltransferase domain-containing protein [Planctomycetota bacterium]